MAGVPLPRVHPNGRHRVGELKRKLMSCSHCQELGQLSDLASDWLFTLVNQKPACLLTQLLTITTTHKFPSLETVVRRLLGGLLGSWYWVVRNFLRGGEIQLLSLYNIKFYLINKFFSSYR